MANKVADFSWTGMLVEKRLNEDAVTDIAKFIFLLGKLKASKKELQDTVRSMDIAPRDAKVTADVLKDVYEDFM